MKITDLLPSIIQLLIPAAQSALHVDSQSPDAVHDWVKNAVQEFVSDVLAKVKAPSWAASLLADLEPLIDAEIEKQLAALDQASGAAQAVKA